MSQPLPSSTPLSSMPQSPQLLTPAGFGSGSTKDVVPEKASSKAPEPGISIDSPIYSRPPTRTSPRNSSRGKSALPETGPNAPSEVEAISGSPIGPCLTAQLSSKSSTIDDCTSAEIPPTLTAEPEVTPNSPASTSINMVTETRAQKRARQDDGSETTPPSKKSANKPKSTPKSTPKPKAKREAKTKAVPNKAILLGDGQMDDEEDSSPAKPAAKPKPKAEVVPKKHDSVNDDDGDSSSAFEKPVVRPKVKAARTPKKPTPVSNHEDGLATPEEPTSTPKTKAKAKPTSKKHARPPPPASTRPSRNRKAPERFEELEEVKPIKATPVSKGPSKVFDPVYITTNSTSRLVKADIYHMLLEESAWTSLSTEQQITLISMLPQTPANQMLLEKIKTKKVEEGEDTRPRALTVNNDCFRTDVAKFQEDLKNGHLAKTWQASAEQAVIERAAGEYDAWKAEEAELWWGQKGK